MLSSIAGLAGGAFGLSLILPEIWLITLTPAGVLRWAVWLLLLAVLAVNAGVAYRGVIGAGYATFVRVLVLSAAVVDFIVLCASSPFLGLWR